MTKIEKILTVVFTSAGAILVNPVTALAQAVAPTIGLRPTEFPTLTGMNISTIVSGGIRLVLVIAALLFFFMLVFGGIQWIVSGGDKAGSENARKKITNALIGLAIVFAAWAIVSLINALFGIDIFNLQVPTLYK